MKFKKILIYIVAMLLFTTAFAGCGGGEGQIPEDLYNYPPLAQPPPEITQTEYQYAINSFDSMEKLLSFNYRDVNGKVNIGYDEQESRVFAEFTIYGNPSKGANAWPCIGMYKVDGNILIDNWSDYRSISMDVLNNTGRTVTLNYKLFDKNYKFIEASFVLESGDGWETCEKIFNAGEKEGFDYTDIVLMEFWVFNIMGTQPPLKLAFDDLRLNK